MQMKTRQVSDPFQVLRRRARAVPSNEAEPWLAVEQQQTASVLGEQANGDVCCYEW